MAKKKNYWYVLVLTETGPVFVTKVNNSNKTAEWNREDLPLELGEFSAKDIAMGLMCNMTTAFAVTNFYELENQPYFYNKGHFEWKWDKNKKKETP